MRRALIHYKKNRQYPTQLHMHNKIIKFSKLYETYKLFASRVLSYEKATVHILFE